MERARAPGESRATRRMVAGSQRGLRLSCWIPPVNPRSRKPHERIVGYVEVGGALHVFVAGNPAAVLTAAFITDSTDFASSPDLYGNGHPVVRNAPNADAIAVRLQRA